MGCVDRISGQTVAVKTETRPVIDGFLENIWYQGLMFDAFVQTEPDILAPATQKTESYFLYDDTNVYVAAKCFQQKSTLRSNQGRKDSDIISEGDFICFLFDPLNDGNIAYFFTINPKNGIHDGIVLEDGKPTTSWDGVFTSASTISEDFWCVEVHIPLSTLPFQNKKIQDWGISTFRYYAQNQEYSLNRIVDIHFPHKVSNFHKLLGLKELKKANPCLFVPYLYANSETDFLSNDSNFGKKVGFDIKVAPNPSILILGTMNPDYAQIETDREIINVSDLPTEYPEKRPFFIESVGFYQGSIAINTRNIGDIKAGLKIKKVGGLFNFDLNGVWDGDDSRWMFGNFRLTDNKQYLAEIIGGIKNQDSRNDFNVTSHIMKWFIDKKLFYYNWSAIINNYRKLDEIEWELVNSVKWKSRTFDAGVWTHIKSQYFNPNIIGKNTLSNENIYRTWLKYSIIQSNGFFRTFTFGGEVNQYELFTHRNNAYLTYKIILSNILHVSETLGNWSFNLSFFPESKQKFRYRNVENFDENLVFEDTFSRFVLIDDNVNYITLHTQSDYSKHFGFTFDFDNTPVRGSNAKHIVTEVYWKLGSSSILKYALDYIDIIGSPYQDHYEQIIHRFHMEYNPTDRINLRLIYQPNDLRIPLDDDLHYLERTINLMFSWEYLPGNFLYFVYNKICSSNRYTDCERNVEEDYHAIVLKLNKTISL